ncbi:Mitogen-activated protein kinase-binding protein 1, partial [Operophtera brumata]
AFSTSSKYLVSVGSQHDMIVNVWDWRANLKLASNKYLVSVGSQHDMIVNVWDWRANLKLASNKYLVSVGSQHDMIVNVWDWRANLKLASNKNGNYFVTVGFRHVKFWYLEYSRNAKFKEPVPLMGRSAILGEQKDNEFCDVVCGRGDAADSTYAITRGGLLCEFNSRRLLDKWVELRARPLIVPTPFTYAITRGGLLCECCADGIVRCFAPDSLRYITTLPRTHYLGVDVAQGTNIKCVRISPDGQHVASGDRAGNIWIHSPTGTLLHTLEAHDAEVLCLEYSQKPRLLASASRDRLIHVFVVDRLLHEHTYHLISASGDGCIFVWRVPHDMVVTMRARLPQQAIRQGNRRYGRASELLHEHTYHLIAASGDGCIFVWRVPHDMVVTTRARLAQQAIRQGK